MPFEDIIALLAAITAFATPLFSIWRLFVRSDNKKRQRQHDLAMAERKAGRQAQIEQNELLTTIIKNGETSMQAVIGVIDTFTKANAQSDQLHEQENKRHLDLLDALKDTIANGQSQHSDDLQALAIAMGTFDSKIDKIEKKAEQTQQSIKATHAAINGIDDTISKAIKHELETMRSSLDNVVSSNGTLVKHTTLIKVQSLLEAKIDGIMDLLTQNRIPIRTIEKGKRDDKATQPITADI